MLSSTFWAPRRAFRAGLYLSWVGASAALLGLGCGSEDDASAKQDAAMTHDAGGDASTSPNEDAGTQLEPGTALHGSFSVSLVAGREATADSDARPPSTSLAGKVSALEEASSVIWEPTQTVDDCQLYEPRVPFCSPSCAAGMACVDDGVCAPFAAGVSVGEVTLSGVGDAPVSLRFNSGSYQKPPGTTLPYPPCDEGDEVSIDARGGGAGAFTLGARCPAPLELGDEATTLSLRQPLTVSWTAGDPSVAKIEVSVDISHHGGSTKGKIECVTDDDGSLEIDPALIGDLINLGVAGFPELSITRVSRRHGQDHAANVSLAVLSNKVVSLQIPGVTSCRNDLDCPQGQTCQGDLQCK